MAKVVSKGTVWKQTIASVLTPVAQVISLEFSGAKAQTYDSTTLDGNVGMTKDLTGYTDPGTLSAELFYDPNLSGHKSLATLLGYSTTAPAQNPMTVTYADAGTTVQSFTCAALGMGVAVDIGSGLKAKVDIDITGDIGFPHT